MNLVFLDMDEVMCGVRTIIAYGGSGDMPSTPLPSAEAWREHTKLDPIACKLLARILIATGAKVVMSSTWRLGVDYRLFNDLFEAWGIPKVCIGKTEQLGTKRGHEIAYWMAEHEELGPFNYVIIDDSSDMLEEQMPRLVRVNGEYGLGFKDYQQAIALLGKVK